MCSGYLIACPNNCGTKISQERVRLSFLVYFVLKTFGFHSVGGFLKVLFSLSVKKSTKGKLNTLKHRKLLLLTLPNVT